MLAVIMCKIERNTLREIYLVYVSRKTIAHDRVKETVRCILSNKRLKQIVLSGSLLFVLLINL